MTHLKQLTIASLMVVAVVALSPIAPHDQPYSSIKLYGKRPQPVFQQETSVQQSTEQPNTSEDLLSHSTGASKVIIRPVSTLSTLPPYTTYAGHKQQENENDGCSCESIDSCPIELMDFRFAVSCEYGTVRCCRPLEPVIIKETPPSRPVVVTPTSTFKWPKKTVGCRCKPRKECDRLFQSNDEQVSERKYETNCPAGSVRCCDTGNMGNPKTETTVPEAHLLGSSEFRPVQLPFLKMPQPADERVSEHEPRPSEQELEPIENSAPITNGNVSSLLEEPEDQAQLTTEKVEEVQDSPKEQQTPLPVQSFQSRPAATAPIQQQVNLPLGVPVPIRQPIRNPAFNNFPPNQNPNLSVGNQQFQQPFQNQPQSFQPMQFRPNPPFRQPGIGLQNQFSQSQFQPMLPNVSPPLSQQTGEKPFNFQQTSNLPNFNQQQLSQMQPPPNAFPQQFPRPPPPTSFQRPPPQQSSGGGGFFSNLMNMFGN